MILSKNFESINSKERLCDELRKQKGGHGHGGDEEGTFRGEGERSEVFLENF